MKIAFSIFDKNHDSWYSMLLLYICWYNNYLYYKHIVIIITYIYLYKYKIKYKNK